MYVRSESGSGDLLLPDDEVHLWFASDQEIADDSLLSGYLDILSEQELAQQRRFHFHKDRHQYLVVRAMLRVVLSKYCDSVPPCDWCFTFNGYGKPAIGNLGLPLNMKFNISHTENMIVLAIVQNNEIGVDIEYLRRSSSAPDIADSFFSPAEQHALSAVEEKQRNARFYDYWTLKEAYIKACGMGLSIPLDSFSFSISSEGRVSIGFSSQRDDKAENWQFWQAIPGPDHILSMALKDTKDYKVIARKVVPLGGVSRLDIPIVSNSIASQE